MNTIAVHRDDGRGTRQGAGRRPPTPRFTKPRIIRRWVGLPMPSRAGRLDRKAE